jgi:transglutaminase-like putative cysteine protease
VCRDFAHVGIALCRSLMLPARFVVGYLHGLEPMDMHAWYEVFLGGRWYAFDATQPEPRGGRVVVAHGRDAADVAFLSNYGPLEIVQMDVSVTPVDVSPGTAAAR